MSSRKLRARVSAAEAAEAAEAASASARGHLQRDAQHRLSLCGERLLELGVCPGHEAQEVVVGAAARRLLPRLELRRLQPLARAHQRRRAPHDRLAGEAARASLDERRLLAAQLRRHLGEIHLQSLAPHLLLLDLAAPRLILELHFERLLSHLHLLDLGAPRLVLQLHLERLLPHLVARAERAPPDGLRQPPEPPSAPRPRRRCFIGGESPRLQATKPRGPPRALISLRLR